jgi:riboflavin synthase
MFTGIVENKAKLVSIEGSETLKHLTIAYHWTDVKHGDSIANNGVCLTVADVQPGRFRFDVIKETLDKTNLGDLRVGDDINVERSLRAGDRMDGHFVQGHVDGTGKLISKIADEKEWRLGIEVPDELVKYIVPKGSISIDGVSLTIAAVKGQVFEVALIPTTLELTTLGKKQIGWRFNLEADILAKTIVHYLELREAK